MAVRVYPAVEVVGGKIDVSGSKVDVSGSSVSVSGRVDVSGSTVFIEGNVDVSGSRVYVNNYGYEKIIDVDVNPGMIVGSLPVNVGGFRTKTVSGRCGFDGYIYIYVSPTPNEQDFYPDPYFYDKITTNKSFSYSFSEAYALVRVSVENITSSSGRAIVYISASTL